MLKILILEDNIQQRENLFKLIIKSYNNVDIYLAGTINEGMLIIQKEDLDLLFVDINLPDGNGLDFAKQIRKFSKYKLTGVIFITTEAIKMIEAFKEIHCYDFLVKPYEIEDIKKVMDVFNEKEYSNKEEDYIIVDIENELKVKQLKYLNRRIELLKRAEQEVEKGINTFNKKNDEERDFYNRIQSANIKINSYVESYESYKNQQHKDCDHDNNQLSESHDDSQLEDYKRNVDSRESKLKYRVRNVNRF